MFKPEKRLHIFDASPHFGRGEFDQKGKNTLKTTALAISYEIILRPFDAKVLE
jgi:hypothetical protein